MNYREVNCAQGSAEWHTARLGKPTASRFAAIITTTGKPTRNAARTAYAAELLQERLTGVIAEHFSTSAMERGSDLEPRARAWYEFTTGRDVKQVGFLDAGRFGCSPDGLCADGSRGLEIKCPLTKNLVALLLEDEAGAAEAYVIQCHAAMWITGLPAWDLVLFSDVAGIPSRIITLQRDAEFCDALAEVVPAFCDELDAAESKLRALGGGITVAE